jgi:hypothetical protein
MDPAGTAHELREKREQVTGAWSAGAGKQVVLSALDDLIAEYEAEAERTKPPNGIPAPR